MDFRGTEHPISWFRDRYRDGSLIIRPPYQRKPVWAARQKCSLIESILMGLPVPEIYIEQATTAEGETTYAIVDGQQRIRTVLQYVGSESDPEEAEHNKFALDKLPGTSPWKDTTFAELTDEQKRGFFSYRFVVRYIDDSTDSEIRDMFRRLNQYLTPLKPQELRNAIYSGPFVRLANRLADDEYWALNRIVTPHMIRRMGDVEFISELLIGVLHGPQGGSSKVIDEYYSQYDDYDDEFPGEKQAKGLFVEAKSLIEKILPKIKDGRWSNKTDFYTLFVGVAGLMRHHSLPPSKVPAVRKALEEFAMEIGLRLAEEEAKVGRNAIAYVRAVEKGANDKKRRADRQIALHSILRPFFKAKQ